MSLIQNAQILCFMKKLHELFPKYSAHDILIKWLNRNKFLYLHSPKKQFSHLKKIPLYINMTVQCENCNVEVKTRSWYDYLKSKIHLENDPDQTMKPSEHTRLCEKRNVQVGSNAWEPHLKSEKHLLREPDKSRKVCEKCNIEVSHRSWYEHLKSNPSGKLP